MINIINIINIIIRNIYINVNRLMSLINIIKVMNWPNKITNIIINIMINILKYIYDIILLILYIFMIIIIGLIGILVDIDLGLLITNINNFIKLSNNNIIDKSYNKYRFILVIQIIEIVQIGPTYKIIKIYIYNYKGEYIIFVSNSDPLYNLIIGEYGIILLFNNIHKIMVKDILTLPKIIYPNIYINNPTIDYVDQYICINLLYNKREIIINNIINKNCHMIIRNNKKDILIENIIILDQII